MIKFRRAKLKPNNGSIVVYYSRDGIMRLPTGITISKKTNKDGKYVEWDYKDNLIKTSVEDYDLKKTQMQTLLERANAILLEYHGRNDVLTATELEKILSEETEEKIQNRVSSVRDEYERFYLSKKEYFKVRDSEISLKDYTSFRNMLADFEVMKNTQLRIRDVDQNKRFLHELLNWLKGPMPSTVGDHKLSTKGKMGDRTCKKRFDVLLQFWGELHEEGKAGEVKFIKTFMRKEINPQATDKVTLTVQEIHELYDHPFSEKNLSNIRDLFVFVCLTGLRWEDLRQFDPRFIFPSVDGAGKVYKKKAHKTRSSSGKTFEIPLCDITLEILENHGGSLKPLMVSNVEANRRVKEVLEKTGRFDTITEIKDKQTGEYLRRFEAVTMHKGRDSFISNLVDVTPLNELMKYTAHSKLSTLQGYLDRNRPVSMTYITKTFNRN